MRTGWRQRLFLSTPSARRATGFLCPVVVRKAISIHALREEGDQGLFFGAVHGIISIHALREEGDDPRKHRARQTI